MKTPVARHKSRNNRRTYKRKTLSHEAKFLDIKTPAAWPKRQETADWQFHQNSFLLIKKKMLSSKSENKPEILPENYYK